MHACAHVFYDTRHMTQTHAHTDPCNIFLLLLCQTEVCRDIVNTWDSSTSRCVQRVPTQRELEDKTLSYEQIIDSDSAPQKKSLIFSAIRSGSVELLTRMLDEFGPCLTLRDDVCFNTVSPAFLVPITCNPCYRSIPF